ncbi:ubiquitin-like protein Pup [Saccharopolyspora sp. MS10]|uniref:ubiquitin-like protein Pup n=1 Tax=Saccharopolyspora sp. MS10 TaxID=3385973 RepID=UPI0039A06AD6
MRRDKHERHHGVRSESDEAAPTPAPAGADRRERLDDDTEAVLDEIDDILEENAETFIRSYIQKGGQ